MFNKFKIIITLLSVVCVSSLQADTKKMLPVETWKTTAGMPVYFVQINQLPMVDVSVMFNAGSAQDGKAYGVANLTSSMLDEGAGKLSADDIAEQFDNTGALFGASATRDMATVSFRSLVDDKIFTPSFALFTTVLSQPTFPEKNFQRVKNQTLQGIKQQDQSPDKVASKAFLKTLYDDNAYGHPVIGETNTVSALTTTELKNFYKNYYVASNGVITIVGDVDKAQAEKMAETISSAIPAGKPATVTTENAAQVAQRNVHVDFPATQTTIYMGELGISRSDPEFIPLYVGNYVLGGGLLVSRLFNEVREKRGLTYGAESAFITMKQPGPFLIAMETRNEKRDEAISVTKDVLKDFVQKGPTDDELKLAKANIIGGYPLQFDSNGSIASMLALMAFYNLPLDYFDTYRDNIQKVSTENIRQAFQDKVQIDNLITVTVGPKVVATNS